MINQKEQEEGFKKKTCLCKKKKCLGLVLFLYMYVKIYEDINSTFCFMFDLQAQAADLVTLKVRLTASEGEVKDLQTENLGNGEHSFRQ